VSEITPNKVRWFVARNDFPHYQALRAFVDWLHKQDKEEIKSPFDSVDAELDTLFRRLSDAGKFLIGKSPFMNIKLLRMRPDGEFMSIKVILFRELFYPSETI
jgi:hypothetical protein